MLSARILPALDMRYLGLSILFLFFLWGLSGLPQQGLPTRNASLIARSTPPDAFEKTLLALKPDVVQELKSRELQALREEPLDQLAVQNLGVIAGLEGNGKRQKALALHLPRYSKRNTAALLTAINIYFRQNNFAQALLLIDPLLRAQPDARIQMFPSLVAMIQQPAAIDGLSQLLQKQPPWRQEFFIFFAKSEALSDSAHDFLVALKRNSVQLRSAELRVILNALLRQSLPDRAYFVWLNTLSTDDLKSANLIFDGEFDRTSDNQFFDWTILKRPTARIAMVARPGGVADKMLNLQFLNDVGPFRHVQQYVRLQPGHFRLTFEQMAVNLQTESGLMWTMRCLKDKALLGSSRPLETSGPWNESVFEFEVPASTCDTQVLTLESATRSVLDMKISGQMAFDRFVIAPI
jgi:hypothetical protein